MTTREQRNGNHGARLLRQAQQTQDLLVAELQQAEWNASTTLADINAGADPHGVIVALLAHTEPLVSRIALHRSALEAYAKEVRGGAS